MPERLSSVLTSPSEDGIEAPERIFRPHLHGIGCVRATGFLLVTVSAVQQYVFSERVSVR